MNWRPRWPNHLHFTIKIKLLLGFLAVALIAGAIGLAGIRQMRIMDERDQELYNLNTVPISLIADISTAFQRMRISLRDMVIYEETERQQQCAAYVRELDKSIDELLPQLEERLTTPEIHQEFEILKTTYKNYEPAREKLMQLALGGEQKKALFLMKREGASVAKAIDDSITKLKELEVAQAGIKAGANAVTAVNSRRLATTLSVAGVLLAIVLGLLISRSINRPLRMAVELTNIVAGGDFTQKIILTRQDEIGELTASLNHMSITLSEMISGTMGAANQLAQSAEAQAASIEETSAAVCEIDGRTGEIARRATTTDELMQHSLAMIGKAQVAMTALLAAIQVIEEAGIETAKIVKVIDGISFQIKLLSLNASVEAARAGESGAGFSVVAEEMRNLALRTTQAANQSTDHIQNASRQIKQGARLARELKETFSLAADDAEKSGTLASEISTVLKEQVASARQIATTLNEMSEATQHHSRICNEMVEQLNLFQINEEDEEENTGLLTV